MADTDPTVSFEFTAQNEQDTQRLGQVIGSVLAAGNVLGLVGNLGAGKTRLTKAIVAGLDANPDDVTSPTFVLIQEYHGRLTVYHFDAYRLSDSDEFLELGADELLYSDGVCLVEWSNLVSDVMPIDMLNIEIKHTGQTTRQFHLTASGPNSTQLVQNIRHAMN